MEIEFHYYITYLIAAKAGFGSKESRSIAYASQYVDDNDMIFEISKDTPEHYSNYISQTMNILKPKKKLLRIYPLFHFIPGDPLSPMAKRKDGKMHALVTTANSENANRIMDAAMESGDYYRIGIATHSYVDSWAHQNFIGYFDEYNAMKGLLEQAVPDIGHADAQNNPDWVALVWKDGRLLGVNSRVDNRARFLEAAKHLFEKYRKYTDPNCSRKMLDKDAGKLIKDLGAAIGKQDQSNSNAKARIRRYKELSATGDYGGQGMKDYNESDWIEKAINIKVRGFRDRSDSFLMRWDPLTDKYAWKNPGKYKQTPWYKFQEGVKQHQDTAWDILYKPVFNNLELERL